MALSLHHTLVHVIYIMRASIDEAVEKRYGYVTTPEPTENSGYTIGVVRCRISSCDSWMITGASATYTCSGHPWKEQAHSIGRDPVRHESKQPNGVTVVQVTPKSVHYTEHDRPAPLPGMTNREDSKDDKYWTGGHAEGVDHLVSQGSKFGVDRDGYPHGLGYNPDAAQDRNDAGNFRASGLQPLAALSATRIQPANIYCAYLDDNRAEQERIEVYGHDNVWRWIKTGKAYMLRAFRPDPFGDGRPFMQWGAVDKAWEKNPIVRQPRTKSPVVEIDAVAQKNEPRRAYDVIVKRRLSRR